MLIFEVTRLLKARDNIMSGICIFEVTAKFILTPSSCLTRYAWNEHLFYVSNYSAVVSFEKCYAIWSPSAKEKSESFIFVFTMLYYSWREWICLNESVVCSFSRTQNLLDRSRGSTCCQVKALRLVKYHVITKSIDAIGQISGHIYYCLKRPHHDCKSSTRVNSPASLGVAVRQNSEKHSLTKWRTIPTAVIRLPMKPRTAQTNSFRRLFSIWL